MEASLVGSEMCIRDRHVPTPSGCQGSIVLGCTSGRPYAGNERYRSGDRDTTGECRSHTLTRAPARSSQLRMRCTESTGTGSSHPRATSRSAAFLAQAATAAVLLGCLSRDHSQLSDCSGMWAGRLRQDGNSFAALGPAIRNAMLNYAKGKRKRQACCSLSYRSHEVELAKR